MQLTEAQHRQLEELCERETRPPQIFGANDYFGLLLQLSRLPEERLKPIFLREQWQKVALQIAHAKGLETELKKEGYVPDDEVAGAAPGARGSVPESKRG